MYIICMYRLPPGNYISFSSFHKTKKFTQRKFTYYLLWLEFGRTLSNSSKCTDYSIHHEPDNWMGVAMSVQNSSYFYLSRIVTNFEGYFLAYKEQVYKLSGHIDVKPKFLNILYQKLDRPIQKLFLLLFLNIHQIWLVLRTLISS